MTAAASGRLFGRADSPAAIADLPEATISELIYPAGFYRTKARQIRETCRRIVVEHGGHVPDSLEALESFPGVGRKTANLVLGVGFGIPAICVDTHVHRIPNRLGWIETKTPGASEYALQEILPRQHWISVNELLVGFGQQICGPVSPRCSICPLTEGCPKIGVTYRR